MKVNQINNIHFGINQIQKSRITPKTQGKLYTKQEALDILLDRFTKVNNEIDCYRKEMNGLFDSAPDEEFTYQPKHPTLDLALKYIPIIKQTKYKKAYIEDALAKVSRLPDGVKIQLDLRS